MCAAANQCMVSASACKLPMAVKYWPAAGLKGAISLRFLMSVSVKNKIIASIGIEIFQASRFIGRLFYF